MTSLPTRHVQTVDDVLALLDTLWFEAEADRWTARGAGWWDGFYADRERGVPFFTDAPDESLVDWHERGLLAAPRQGARVLDVGCGNGRNAVWLARHGYEVDALDLSAEAAGWAREAVAAAGVQDRVRVTQGSVFDWATEGEDPPYDLVVDSGCYHHLPPHRRVSYRALLERALRPGGRLAIACFAAGAMGSEEPDDELYRAGHLAGGVAYSAQDLRHGFAWLEELELRRMRADVDGCFGAPFLWVGLFRRP